MTTKMPKWLSEKQCKESTDYEQNIMKENPNGVDVTPWSNSGWFEEAYADGFDACFELVVPELLDALKSVAPSWLPEAVREKRRKVLEKYDGRTE